MVKADPLNGELQNEIRKFLGEVFPTIPKDIAATLMSTTADLVRSGIADRAVKQGDRAPDFSLASVRGGSFHLAERLARGPAVVTFYRGGW